MNRNGARWKQMIKYGFFFSSFHLALLGWMSAAAWALIPVRWIYSAPAEVVASFTLRSAHTEREVAVLDEQTDLDLVDMHILLNKEHKELSAVRCTVYVGWDNETWRFSVGGCRLHHPPLASVFGLSFQGHCKKHGRPRGKGPAPSVDLNNILR